MKIKQKTFFIPCKLALVICIIALQSCDKKPPQKDSATIQTRIISKKITKDSIVENQSMQKNASMEIEVFDVNKMRFNGKVGRFFSLQEFETVFGKADSTKLMSEEEPCAYIFENPDGSKDMDDRYLYKNGSRFENNKNRVAVDEFRFNKGNFLKYKNATLNSETTVKDLKKLFPNATHQIGNLDVFGEGKLQVIELREDTNNISDGHIKVFLKNGKLYFMHWWFPC